MVCLLADLDLSGILISDYPDDLTLDECRERLECEIEEAYDEFEPPLYVEESEVCPDGKWRWTGKKFCVNPPSISPYSIFLVTSMKARRELEKMHPAEYEEYVNHCWSKRAERFEKLRKEKNFSINKGKQ